jgi:hypothetical protein
MERKFFKTPAVLIAVLLAAGIVLAGCFNMLEAPESGGGGDGGGAGTIILRLGGESRTLLPTAPLAFARYSIAFAPGSGQAAVDEIFDADPVLLNGSGQKLLLPAGAWTITVTAWAAIDGVAGLENGEYPAARGSAAITVTGGESNTPVSVTVDPITDEGEGVLSYRAETGGTVNVLTLAGQNLSPAVSLSLAAGDSGTTAIPAGYYLITAENGSGGKTAAVLHIYSGMVTRTVLGSDFVFTSKAPAAGESSLVLRYEVNTAGSAFTAVPASGSTWDAALNSGAAITALPGGRKVVDTGGGDGWVDLGAKFGEELKKHSQFTVETYVYLPLSQPLSGNGHFIWTFSTHATANANNGKYIWLRASTRSFAISGGGYSSEQKSDDNSNIEKGIWRHVVFTMAADKTMTLYIDGEVQGSRVSGVDHTAWTEVNYNYLAKPVFSGDNYLKNAKYYRLSLYNKAFTASEVKNAMGADDVLAEFPVDRIKTLPDTVPMKHVGGLHTEEDFARIRANINAEPWKSGYAKLTESNLAKTSFTPYPTASIERRNEGGNFMNAARSSHAAYQMAIRWKISEDAAYAVKAVDILNKWADVCTEVTGDSNLSLASGLYGYAFAVAGELLRDYSGWASADFTDFKNWMLTVFWPKNQDFLNRHHDTRIDHYWANWDLANLASALAIGILTDRRDIYNYAVDYLQDARSTTGNGNFFKNINNIHDYHGEELGQMQESGRDQGHATLCIALTGVICQLTWNQGDDFFGFDNNRYLKGCEYTARYNVAGLDVPFATYVRRHGPLTSADHVNIDTHTGVSPASRYTSRPMWSLPYYHYTRVKGIESGKIKYTRMGLETTFPEGGGSGGGNSGEYDQLGFGTLMYAR